MMNTETLKLTEEWDKTFQKATKSCIRRLHLLIAMESHLPQTCINLKMQTKSHLQLAVCGPFGAVKEQCSGLYAQIMAERGFLTVAFDPSYTGESGGLPRYMASPDINTEDFMAAADFLLRKTM